ncbi:MAG TPA: choice-of-anchor Q domain-containing protein [Kofleriaceae bacterium]|jgi:predicted outer membrane repeat protein
MRRVLISILVLAACGKHGGSGGDDDDTTSPDANQVTPAGSACDAPVSPVDTSQPDHVVGSGDPSTCTEAALGSAIAAGGIITFDCGSAAATIAITQTLELRTDVATTIDGGNLVTIDGGGAVRILDFDHTNYRTNTITLTLQHLTLAHGHAKGTMTYPPEQSPCSQGYYDGYGGALQIRDGELVVIDVTFESNQAAELGPDVGGGAISMQGCLKGTIEGSVFHANAASNGGAIESLNSDFDVYNSTFDGNTAEGNGANSNDMSKCSVLDPMTNQYQVGSGGNGGAVAIDGGADGTHTFCGVQFTNNQGGSNALGGAIGRTPDNAMQTTVIDRCTFDGNHGDSAGAGYFHNSALQVTASTFSNNVAVHGSGALQADGTVLALLNDTFSANNAMAGLGGAISLFDSGSGGTIAFTTFVGNLANGGDPYFGAAIGGNPILSLVSDLFANNTAQNPGAPMQCQVMGTGSGDFQWPMDHAMGGGSDVPCTPATTFADPMLGMLADHGGASETAIPGTGSPARGGGVTCPPTDQRGMPRPATGCTSGSVEPQVGE